MKALIKVFGLGLLIALMLTIGFFSTYSYVWILIGLPSAWWSVVALIVASILSTCWTINQVVKTNEETDDKK